MGPMVTPQARDAQRLFSGRWRQDSMAGNRRRRVAFHASRWSSSSTVSADRTPSSSPGRPRAASRRLRSSLRKRSAAPSSMPIPCRSIATCASSRRGRRRKRRRGCRICSTAMSMPPRTIRSAAGASMRRRRLRRRRRAGRLPILVGGTGLYFKALTQGLAAVPPMPADIRAAIRGRLASEGVAPLYAELDAARSRRRRSG